MPELPEVETIAHQLDMHLREKILESINVKNPNSFLGNPKKLEKHTVMGVGRRAKTLIFTFGEDLFMLIHLKMTGQLIFVHGAERVAGGHPSHDFHASLPNSHTRVVFSFSDGSVLYFNDLRKFGWCRAVTKNEMDQYFSTYGPEAFPLIDYKYLIERAKRMSRSNIKKFLLDQNVLSGIGNIYADEVLFEMKLHPETLVSKLKDAEWEKLAVTVGEKLRFAIEKGGTSDSDYLNANGEKGGMQDYLNVYHRTGEDCPRGCGGKVERIRVAGRGTHYCPVCQRKRT